MEVELINIVSFGGGTNSAAMLVGLHQHGIPVDLILFANTGAEQPHTYCFIETMNEWLAAHNMPSIITVENVDRFGNRLSLETECLRSQTLPSIAYGYKSTRSHRRENSAITILRAVRCGHPASA